MNKVKAWGIFLLLFISNFFIIKEHNIYLLLFIFTGIILISLYLNCSQKLLKRFKVFVILGIFILFFQLLFNQTGLVIERILLAFRVILQLIVISESIFLVMKLVSPLEIVKSFNFLPKFIQILLSMTFYFIPQLMKEYETVKLVQTARGLGQTIFSRLLSPIYIIIPLMHRVFQRTETITYTVLSRGYEN